jgi:hypothetical protein
MRRNGRRNCKLRVSTMREATLDTQGQARASGLAPRPTPELQQRALEVLKISLSSSGLCSQGRKL